MKSPIIFDGRNLYSLESMENKNFYYQSVGRKVINNLNK
jgi:UDPglucose 6-dehydrogenase